MSDVETKPKKRAASKQTAQKVADNQAPKRRDPEVPRSAFNFIAVQWEAKRRRRRSVLLVGGVVGTALVIVGTMGYRASSEEGGLRAKREAAQNEIQSVKAEVAKVFGPGGADVVEHMRNRRGQIDAALAFNLSPTVVKDQIVNLVDPTIKVLNLQFAVDSASIAAAAPAPTTTTAGETATTAGPTSTAPAQSSAPQQIAALYNISIQLAATSYDDLPRVEQQLAQAKFLSAVTVNWGGSPESGLTINVTAKFDPTTMQAERTEYFQKLQGF